MKEILEFLTYLKEVKFFAYPKIHIYDDGSGHISYDIDQLTSDVELFDFNSLEELNDKIKWYKRS